MKLGQKVTTQVSRKSYYHNEIPLGTVGIIGALDVACVRLRATCKCPTFVCVDFPDGARAAYHKHEFTKGGSL